MARATKKSTKAVSTVKASNIPQTVSAEIVRDQIAVLRMGMSQSIMESISVSILALLLFIGAPSVFPEIINPYLPSSLRIMQILVVVPSVVWLLAMLGNLVRYFMILKLRKKLVN